MSTLTTFVPDVCSDERTATEPLIRAKTPLRISFAGGGTDFPHWFHDKPGAVLCATITNYTRVTLYPRADRHVRIRSVDLGYLGKYHIDEGPVYDGMMDLVKAAITRLGCTRGMDLDISSEAPPGSGLGGSSALVSSVIGAVSRFQNIRLDAYEVADLNYQIERKDLGIPGGVQDQYGTTFGGFNLIEFSKDGVLVNPLRLSDETLADLEAHLLMCYVGNVRASTGLIDRQIRYGREKRAQDGMARIYSLVYDMKAALLKGNLAQFGELLHEGFVNKKLMNPAVTEGTPTDALYELAREKGAIGGKLLGAGGGGYLLLYCETHRQHDVREALEAGGGIVKKCAFDHAGLRVWHTRSL